MMCNTNIFRTLLEQFPNVKKFIKILKNKRQKIIKIENDKMHVNK